MGKKNPNNNQNQKNGVDDDALNATESLEQGLNCFKQQASHLNSPPAVPVFGFGSLDNHGIQRNQQQNEVGDGYQILISEVLIQTSEILIQSDNNTHQVRQKNDQNLFKKASQLLKRALKILRTEDRSIPNIKLNKYIYHRKDYILQNLQIASRYLDENQLLRLYEIFKELAQNLRNRESTQRRRNQFQLCMQRAIRSFKYFIDQQYLDAFKQIYNFRQMRQRKAMIKALETFLDYGLSNALTIDQKMVLFLRQIGSEYLKKMQSKKSQQQLSSCKDNSENAVNEDEMIQTNSEKQLSFCGDNSEKNIFINENEMIQINSKHQNDRSFDLDEILQF